MSNNPQQASGTLADGERATHEFSGEITALRVDGDCDVTVDGEAVDPSSFDDATPPEEEPTPEPTPEEPMPTPEGGILAGFDTYPDGYLGDVDGFSTSGETTTALGGLTSNALIASETVETARGEEYRCYARAKPGSYQRVLVNVQDPTAPMDACYALFFGGQYGDLALQERQNGDRVALVTADHDFENDGTETYAVGIASDDSAVWAILYDSSGTEIVRTDRLESATHHGGTLGFGVGPVSGVEWGPVVRVGPSSPPDEAPTDSSSTDATDPLPHEVRIDASGGGAASYRVVVPDGPEPAPNGRDGASINSNDTVRKLDSGEWEITGHVKNGIDAWDVDDVPIEHTVEVVSGEVTFLSILR